MPAGRIVLHGNNKSEQELGLALEHGVTVVLDKKAKDWAAEKGYDPVFGARPLKRFLQRNIETKLARALIGGQVAEGSEVKFTVKDDELVMK
jgi:ATP-dependent Clp protease ATP-binding subunit ClpB